MKILQKHCKYSITTQHEKSRKPLITRLRSLQVDARKTWSLLWTSARAQLHLYFGLHPWLFCLLKTRHMEVCDSITVSVLFILPKFFVCAVEYSGIIPSYRFPTKCFRIIMVSCKILRRLIEVSGETISLFFCSLIFNVMFCDILFQSSCIIQSLRKR